MIIETSQVEKTLIPTHAYIAQDASPVPLLKCNTTTNGEWVQLYPPLETTLNGLLCFVQNFGFTYDFTADKIVPKRKGISSR